MIEMYILDHNHKPVAVDDVLTWGRWFEDFKNRRIAEDSVAGVKVSTIFLGLDRNFGDRSAPPLLFETMTFGDAATEEGQWRWATWDEAVAGHAEIVAKLRAKQPMRAMDLE